MRRRRLSGLVVLLVAALAATAAAPVPGQITGATGTDAAPAVALAGTNSLSTRGATSVDVSLSRDVTASLAATDNPNLTLSSDAEAATAVLVGPGDAALLWSRISTDVLCNEGSAASCEDFLSQLHVLSTGLERPEPNAHARVLPAGDYTLHVVPSDPDALTTVTLEFDELSGAVIVPAGAASPHKFLVLDDMSPTSGAALVTAGDSGQIEQNGGTLFRFVAATGSVTGPSEAGDCIYAGEPTLPAPLAYAPPCPLADDSTSARFLAAGNVFTYALMGITHNVEAGVWSQGGYVGGPMLAENGFVAVLWLG